MVGKSHWSPSSQSCSGVRTRPSIWSLFKASRHHREQHTPSLPSLSLCPFTLKPVQCQGLKQQYPRRIITYCLENQTVRNMKLISNHVNILSRFQPRVSFIFLISLVFIAFTTLGIKGREMLLHFYCFVLAIYNCDYFKCWFSIET